MAIPIISIIGTGFKYLGMGHLLSAAGGLVTATRDFFTGEKHKQNMATTEKDLATTNHYIQVKIAEIKLAEASVPREMIRNAVLAAIPPTVFFGYIVHVGQDFVTKGMLLFQGENKGTIDENMGVNLILFGMGVITFSVAVVSIVTLRNTGVINGFYNHVRRQQEQHRNHIGSYNRVGNEHIPVITEIHDDSTLANISKLRLRGGSN